MSMDVYAHRLKTSIWRRGYLCLLIALIILGLDHDRFGAFQGLENGLYDFRAKLIAKTLHPSDDIVVIAVDDESLDRMQEAVGSWPWIRNIHGALIHHCQLARVIAFDVLFSETDQQLQRHHFFIEKVEEHQGVISATYLNDSGSKNPLVEDLNRFQLPAISNDVSSLQQYNSAITPFAELQQKTHSIGHINYSLDSDGVMRTYMPYALLNQKAIPSLALASAMLYKGVKAEHVFVDNKRCLHLGESHVFLQDDRRLSFVTHKALKKGEYYKTYSIADVFTSANRYDRSGKAAILPSAFEDKIVLIGSTALGLQANRKITPTDPMMPDVYIHAAAIDNLIHGRSISQAPYFVKLLLIFILSFIPGLINVERRPDALIGIGVVVALIYFIVSLVLAWGWQCMLPVSAPIFGLFISLFVFSLNYWSHERVQRRYLEQMETAKQQFTDMLVHDLKGRISSMVISLDMIETQLKPEEKKKERIINNIRASGSRLLAQVNALLDIRKMEEGRMPLNREKTNINSLLTRVLDEYHTTANLIGLQFEKKLASDINPTYIDPDIFQRIMGNLVWNALQYAKRGTCIKLRTIQLNNEVLVQIINQGKSISPEEQKKLFKPFSSLTEKAEKNVKSLSTGLGLSFCKLAMETHGGHIKLQSPLPQGEDGVLITLHFPQSELL